MASIRRWSVEQIRDAKERVAQDNIAIESESQRERRMVEAGDKETRDGIATVVKDEAAWARTGIDEAKVESEHQARIGYARMMMMQKQENERIEKHRRREEKARMKAAQDAVLAAVKEEIVRNMEIEDRMDQLKEQAEQEQKATAKKLEAEFFLG